MAELADAQDLGSCVFGRESSSLSTRTVSWAGAQNFPGSSRWQRFGRPDPMPPNSAQVAAPHPRDPEPSCLTFTILRLDSAGRVYFPRPSAMCQPRWSALSPSCARLTWSVEAAGTQAAYDSRGRLTLPTAFRKHLTSASVIFLTTPEAISLVLDAAEAANTLWKDLS